MAYVTSYAGVLADQFEVGQAVIELGRLAPALRCVANSAQGSKLAVVPVFFLVAGVAILRGDF